MEIEPFEGSFLSDDLEPPEIVIGQRDQTTRQLVATSTPNEKVKDSGKKTKVRENYNCDSCDYVTSRRSNLTRHAETHKFTNSRDKHICNHCGKQFLSSYGCNIHINQVHQEKYRFMCTICDKGFMQMSNYQGHVASHHRLKPYKCNRCGTSYTHFGSARRHEQVCGKNSEKFTCDLCGRCFEHQKYLEDHIRGKHSAPSYHCECGKVFKWRSSLKKHRSSCPGNGPDRE